MAQSSESIETQPPPEVRQDEDKLQPDLHPPQPEPPVQPQPQPGLQPPPPPPPQPRAEPPAIVKGERALSSAAVASNVQPGVSSAIPHQSNGDGTQDSNEKGSGNNRDGVLAGGTGSATETETGAGAVKTGAEATSPPPPPLPPPPAHPAPDSSLHPTHVSAAQPHVDHNGHGGQNGTRNSGSAPLSPSPPMSGHGARPPHDSLHRQSNMLYQPPSSIHTGSQYAYSAQLQQQQQQQQQQQHHHDPYRASPGAMNSSMSLPSMRTFDQQQQQQLQQQSPPPPPPPQHGYSMGAPMGQQMAGQMGLPGQGGMTHGPPVGMPSYYSTTLPPNPYAMQVDPNGMRYAILPEIDPRIILANRQKKEIKRRTKTGCLTCRKRRIKCDEAHPTCNNCKKSKRDCLGYDPIFRQTATQAQAQAPAPVRIQPAPSPTNINNTPPSATPSLVSPPAASAASPVAPPLHHAPVVPSTYPPTADTLSPPNSEGRYNHSGPIDPVLRGFDSTPRGYESAPRIQDTKGAPRPAESALPSINPQVRTLEPSFRPGEQAARPTGSASDPSSTAYSLPSPETERTNSGDLQHQQQQQQQQQHPHPVPRAKKMRVDELIALSGAAPHALSSPPNEQTVDEIVRLYYEVYVPGLDLFFETKWYDFKNDNDAGVTNPLGILRLNKRVLDTFGAFLRAINEVKTTSPADMVYSGHLESCVVWELARLPYVAAYGAPSRPGSISLPAEDDATEVRSRLQVFETLLAGDTLSTNPLFPPPPPTAVTAANQIRVNELEFWYRLAEYLLQSHSSPSEAHVSTREQCLSRMRAVLDGRENRDVIYSITVLREYTMRFDASHTEQTAPAHLDETDPRSKLAVATRFIQDEAVKTGTTNVVRRFADLAYRAYVRPGGNVRRS